MSVWKSDETLLSICILNFSFKNDFVWEEISNIRHSVSSPDETPRSSSKILRCASYFQLSSRCFIWWWNTASHVWYITSHLSYVWNMCENIQYEYHLYISKCFTTTKNTIERQQPESSWLFGLSNNSQQKKLIVAIVGTPATICNKKNVWVRLNTHPTLSSSIPSF